MGMFKKKYVVGLDIGSSSTKLVQCIKKEDRLQFIKDDFLKIQTDDDVLLRDKEIVSALKGLLIGIDIKESYFIISINCPKTAIRKVTVPIMPKNELSDGIRLAAQSYFPFPIESASLDFEIVNEFVEGEVKKYQVLVAVSPRNTIDRYLSILRKVGVEPNSIIPVPYALQKLAEATSSATDQVKCLVDIGEQFTEAVIYPGPGQVSAKAALGGSNKSLLLYRKILIAGNNFTKALTMALISEKGKVELSYDEAEKLKQEVGLPPENEPQLIDGKISTVQILSMIRQPLKSLADEIGRYFDYYSRETGGERVALLEILGGGAYFKGLNRFLAEELGINVRVGDPLEGRKIDFDKVGSTLKENSSQFAVAIGLTLTEGEGINLLPIEIKEKIKIAFKRSIIELISVGTICIIIFMLIGMFINLKIVRDRIEVANSELSSLQHQLKKIEMQNLINKILVDKPYWGDVTKELSNIVPNHIYLTRLSMKKKVLRMEGIILSKEKEKIISDFVSVLENGIFNNVKLVTIHEMKNRNEDEFELTCFVD